MIDAYGLGLDHGHMYSQQAGIVYVMCFCSHSQSNLTLIFLHET